MPSAPVFPPKGHAHGSCTRAALAHARAVCARAHARLTKNREAVLRILLAAHKPMGAYEIIARFDWQGRTPAPAQIYRAIRFLEHQGLVHRLASRNRYFACFTGDSDCPQASMLCERCGSIAELAASAALAAARRAAAAAGFEVRASALEISGLCPNCREAAP